LTVTIPRALLARIVAAAERAYPEEGCGLLIGRREPDGRLRVTELADSANVADAPSRRRRFEVDPAVRFAAMRRLRGTGEDVVGHWHSHPDGPAEPSAYDAAMAFEPGLAWLIVAVAGGNAAGTAAFEWDAGMAAFRSRALVLDT
jgi:proteasome lid subunit RPN8/RPN11